MTADLERARQAFARRDWAEARSLLGQDVWRQREIALEPAAVSQATLRLERCTRPRLERHKAFVLGGSGRLIVADILATESWVGTIGMEKPSF